MAGQRPSPLAHVVLKGLAAVCETGLAYWHQVQDRWRVVWLFGACANPRVQPRLLQRTQGGTSCAEALEGSHLLWSNANLAYIRHLLDHVSVRTTEDYDRLAADVMLRKLQPPTP